MSTRVVWWIAWLSTIGAEAVVRLGGLGKEDTGLVFICGWCLTLAAWALTARD